MSLQLHKRGEVEKEARMRVRVQWRMNTVRRPVLFPWLLLMLHVRGTREIPLMPHA